MKAAKATARTTAKKSAKIKSTRPKPAARVKAALKEVAKDVTQAEKRPTSDEPLFGKPVLVVTENRAVYFGRIISTKKFPNEIDLSDMRNIFTWVKMRGFLDLAVAGPNKECCVGPAVAFGRVIKVVGIWECTPAATKAWDSATWVLK